MPDTNASDLVSAEMRALRARVHELELQLGQLVDAEERLAGAQAQAQALLDNIPHMAWMKDRRGAFLAVNEAFAQACGHPRRVDILGKTDRDVWPTEHAERYMTDDLRVIASGERFFVEEPIHEGDTIKWFETFKTPIRDGAGAIIGTVGLARDITDRKRAEQQRRELEHRMQEAQRLESLGLLAGGIAHDFNNLLVGVLANADLVLEALLRNEAREHILESVNDIKSAALHAAGLTSQMLAYSGRGRFDVRAISLNETVSAMGHLLRAVLSKKAQVLYELAPDLPTVKADVAQVQQVIMNLIINASDALEGRPGTIHVRTTAEVVTEPLSDVSSPPPLEPGSYVCFEVTDDGCGMSEEVRQKLFDPFFTTKFTGRGLGLSAVQGIVRGHGGGISVESAPGVGTTIKVFLRCAEAHLPAAKRAEQTGPAANWTGSGLVLLVDDDEHVRVAGEMLLRSLGLDVVAVASGREALTVFDQRGQALRLIMLDWTMPDFGGEQVLRELERRHAKVPVLVCSGYGEAGGSRNHGLVASFLQKPYSLDMLRTQLQKLLG